MSLSKSTTTTRQRGSFRRRVLGTSAQPDEPSIVVVIDDPNTDNLVPFTEWLALVGAKAVVTLPKPTAPHLDEARVTGEV